MTLRSPQTQPITSKIFQATARVLIGLAALPIGPFGCSFDWTGFFPKKKQALLDSSVNAHPLANSAAYRDTAAEYAYIDGLRRMRVRNYGIVSGLGERGSRRCPGHIREQLIQEMYKSPVFASGRKRHVTPEQLLDDPGTAVVAVEGEIPALATSGSRFDVVVRSLPGTDTVSLAGGSLLSCELQLFRTAESGWIPGQTLAEASGPVFMNPFAAVPNAATKTSLLEGVVVGGGVATQDRRFRLRLAVPSYRIAMAIEQAVNERFASSTREIADAVSPSEVRLALPDEYRHDPKHFVSLVQHVYLPMNRPDFLAQRRTMLVQEFAKPASPHAEISFAWEAIGRTALPDAQRFYTHDNPACRFYAGMAGLQLGDDEAVDIISSFLTDAASSYRLAAIQVLGNARKSRRAARPLREALNDTDPRIRCDAYEALWKRQDPAIVPLEIAPDAFVIDLVPSTGPNMIYAKRTDQQRIALFGESIAIKPPIFLELEDDTLILRADSSDRQLTVIRKSRGADAKVSPPIPCPLDAKRLIALLGQHPPTSAGQPVTGLGFDYSTIVGVVADLCRSGAINAEFQLENPAQLLLPRTSDQFSRPESDAEDGEDAGEVEDSS